MDDYIEYFAVAFGVIYVVLAARGIIWCWAAGILSSILYIYINLHHTLYQDAILQTYYVLAGFYGWWIWNKKDTHPEEQDVLTWSLSKNGKLILLGVILVPLFGYGFSKLGNSLPYFDAAVTVFSFIATWMTAKKILENWLFWIVIDVIAAGMYFVKGLHATSGLYIFYSIVAIYGYYQWRKQLKLV
ncbi:MAG: nicotinamide mononucleotide transporter [Bacteroidetes bacterium]|nr:nicotinamide mononucleotide transporter [Bacteroidota bacterium]